MNSKFLIIILLIFTIQAFPQQDVKIISSDRNSLVIEYTPSFSDTSNIKINGQNFINLNLRFGFVPAQTKSGEPGVPERIINIGVPSETGNTIQVLSSSYKIINGSIAPKPKLVKKGKMPGFAYELSKDYSNSSPSKDLVRFGIYGLMRSVPVQSLILSPVEFEPGSRSIKLYNKIIFRISFSNNQTISSIPASNLLNGALVNYNVAKYWGNRVDRKLQKKTVINSVLASGTWVRFEAPTEGIYKITKSMLPLFGIDPNTVDPRTIKIYNNGGKVLPEDINSPRPSDLVENAIIVVGEEDGKFDDGDYILFYGRGNDFWDYDSSTGTFKRFYHPYSNQNYYWITSGGARGKRMVDQPSVNSPSAYQQTSTTSFIQWDLDEVNIGKTGREYYGDNFTPDITSRTYVNKLNGRIDSYPIKYNVRFINASPSSVGLEVDENSTPIINQYLYGYGSPNNYRLGNAFYYSAAFNGVLPDNRSVLKFSFNPSDITSVGYLDYFEINYQQQLLAVNDNLLFFSKDTTAAIQYNLSGFSSSNIKVFNISDYSNAKLITNLAFQNAGQCTFQSNETAKNVSRYFAVGNDNFLTPANPVQMSNSNLHGIQTGAKFIVITNKIFDDAAQRLKTYKETQAPEKISTIIVNVDQIFNEFSCGMLDPTAIRDFIAYAYNNWQIKPEYVLFLGKGTYDPKDVEGFHNDYVPAYETQESLDEINSLTTDDYYVEISGNDPIVDLAFGRITCETSLEANTAVDKIIQYESNTDKGPWQNLITLVADDGWHSEDWEGAIHVSGSEALSTGYIPNSFDQNKVYLAAYPPVLTSLGRRIPDANQAIINSINQGTLIMNYVGHGDDEQWADENVFNKNTSFQQLHNNRYFLLVAATCDFGYWDITNFQSASEALLFQQNSGCIAAFSACRLGESSDNQTLDQQLFYEMLSTPRDSLDLPITLGQAVFLAKQSNYDNNSQKYEILGDPTVRLNMPQYSATIDSINGQNLSSPIQIKALSTVRMNGEIRNPDGSLWNNFNGTGVLTMFDSKRVVPLANLDNYPMVTQGGIIFRGMISVTNGKFSSSFVVPKDISYENQNGKIILYFYNNSADGLAYTNNIIVGGTDSIVTNTIGPDIKIFFDDTTSSNATLVNPNSTLIVKLFDVNGLNTTGTGVGHKLEGILNGQDNNPLDFTNYFTGYLDAGGKSGQINFPLNNLNLSSGNYSLKVVAWDVFNNYASKTANFTVVNGNGLIIQDVYNYPDPFAYNTTFTFQQNLNFPVNVKVKVFTVAGRLVREIEKQGISNKFVKVDWDGRDQNGDLLANGTYLYKIIVNTVDGMYNQSVLGKMAIIR